MSKEFDLVVVGEINPDIILRDDDLVPVYGQTEKLIADADVTVGSSAVIVAAGAAKLGLKVAFIGVVAQDHFADYMLTEMAKLNINTTAVKVIPGVKSGFSIIFSQEDRAILTYSGSIGKLRYEQIDFKTIESAKHLHLSSYFLLKDLQTDIPKLLQQAKALGLSTSIDCNWDPNNEWRGIDKALKYTDLLLPNENELLALSKHKNVNDALTELVERVAIVGLKLGANGAIAKTKNNEIRMQAIKVNVLDTTGAGDSFDAGFLHGFINGFDLQSCLRQAIICGSLSTRASAEPGLSPTLPK